MTVEYTITPQLRVALKVPFGRLVEGTFDETMAEIKQMLDRQKPPRLISVGDVVSKNLHSHCLHPQLTVIDNISLRDQAVPQEETVERTIKVKNPQGTITKEAAAAIKNAIAQNKHTHIIVDGEEDLLVLIAVLYAPNGSFVVYGQPHCGIVVVEVSAEKKAQAAGFLKAMEPSKS